MFACGREKKIILSYAMTERDAKNILKNGFQFDKSLRIAFPVSINFRPASLYFFYCEIMYDIFAQENPMQVVAAQNDIVLAEFANKYFLNSTLAVRIHFMFTLDSAPYFRLLV